MNLRIKFQSSRFNAFVSHYKNSQAYHHSATEPIYWRLKKELQVRI